MFLTDLMHTMAGDGTLTHSHSNAAVAFDSRLFDRLPIVRQRQYSMLADQQAEAKELESIADRSHLMSQRALARERLAQEQKIKASEYRI